MSLTPRSWTLRLKSHPQLEAEDSTGSTDLQGPCDGPFLIRTYVRSALAAAQPLERRAGRAVEAIRQRRPTLLVVLHRFQVAPKGLRGPGLPESPRGRPHRRIGRDHAHALALAVLAGQPLDQGIRVRGE